jgi:WD repeat-containing protein 17
MFAVGCKDGRIRIFDIYHDKPRVILEGHTDRIYNVVFNPSLPNLLASGSDDKSIRIWDLDQQDSQAAISVLGGTGAHSHTQYVRALAFAPDIVWCLLSGSWDSTIKIWDIRTGACMLTLNDHNSDVYAISFQ